MANMCVSIVNSPRFQINVSERGLSSITAGTRFLRFTSPQGCCWKPLAIFFSCKREADHIDPSMTTIHRLILEDKIREQLEPSSVLGCGGSSVAGHCGNLRGALTECRCETLDRIHKPDLRKTFEDTVIARVVKMYFPPDFPFSPFSYPPLNIAIFAPGGLHGEVVLVIKLVHQLALKGFNGEINLFLIDNSPIYKNSIKSACNLVAGLQGRQSCSWDELLGNRADLKQFLTEISFCLPRPIEVNGSVFAEADDYICATKIDSGFKHDLLIGSDIDEQRELVKKIKLNTQKVEMAGVMLMRKSAQQAELCDVGFKNGLFYCNDLHSSFK